MMRSAPHPGGLTAAEKRARRQARDEARASGVRLDLLIQLLLAPAPPRGGLNGGSRDRNVP